METFRTLSEVKARFSEVIGRVENGEEVVVARLGRPVARVVAYKPVAAGSRLGFASNLGSYSIRNEHIRSVARCEASRIAGDERQIVPNRNSRLDSIR